MPKRGLGVDVLTAAKSRVAWSFDRFEKVYVSFSGGKDSTVMLHLAAKEARARGRRIGVLIVDLEAQYRATSEHIERCVQAYSDVIDLYWVALPLSLRNAVSNFEPQWTCWDPDKRAAWVREPPKLAITDPIEFPFFRHGMEFEDFVPAFGEWYADGAATACLVGIRSDESLNRYRTLVADKAQVDGLSWTTWVTSCCANVYPVYDWATADIWTYHARTGDPHNRVYDLMHLAGLTIHQMRLCQPYGDDQKRGLWLYHVLEPDTWPRVVARVNGAGSGALYAGEIGGINGRIRIDKPEGHTWKSYVSFLLASMPPATQAHYEAKIRVFLRWYSDRGYPAGIPDEAPVDEEAARKTPSWRRVAKTILRNDYWCKGLSFSQHKSGAYEAYMKVQKARARKWAISF